MSNEPQKITELSNTTTLGVQDTIIVIKNANTSNPLLREITVNNFMTVNTLQVAVNNALSASPSISTNTISNNDYIFLYVNNAFATITSNNFSRKVGLVLPTYADNASAVTGGLPVGALYKTATGEVRVVV